MPIPGTSRNPGPTAPCTPADPATVVDFDMLVLLLELECVRTPSLPHRQTEGEDHPSQLPRPTGQPRPVTQVEIFDASLGWLSCSAGKVQQDALVGVSAENQ